MDKLTFGWEEWVSLPDLGLPAIKAKVDTGARTSALHAHDIEVFGPAKNPKVRFYVHPIGGRTDVAITCSAPLVDRREVTSSNGETEQRFVIASTLRVAGQSWPIEITLTNRATMTSRMLLGRQALADHISISPVEKHLQPELSYEEYHTAALKRRAPKRALRIAVLSREDNYSTRRLVDVGEARGHAVEVIRQFEAIGTYCVNGSAGITASRDKLHAHQVLATKKIGMPSTAFAASPKDTSNLMALVGTAPLIVKLLESTQGKGVVLAETKKAAESVIDAFRGLKANFLVQDFVKEAAGEDIRCLVIAGKVVAAMKRTGAEGDFRSNLHRGGSAKMVRITKQERDTAVRAARAFGLGKAGVDLLRSSGGPKVLEVNSSPGFEGIEKASGKDIVGKLYDEIELRVKPQPTRKRARR